MPKGSEMANEKKRRPIGLSTMFRRWLMLTVCARLIHVAVEFKLIHPGAFGFIGDLSVHDVIYPIQAFRDWALTQRRPLYILWLDAFKAFDSMHWGALFAYMRYCGMNLMVRFLFTVFTQASWVIVTGHGLTKHFTPTNGGPQGCPTTCPCYILSLSPLMFKLDELSFDFRGLPISCLSYVDDLHCIHIELSTFRKQIELCERFYNATVNKILPTDGKVKVLTNDWGLRMINMSKPLTVAGYTLTVENGGIVMQARILGGCVHMSEAACQWRCARREEEDEDRLRCCGLGATPASKAAVIETFFYSRYMFGIETCIETLAEIDKRNWAPLRKSIQHGMGNGGYIESYSLDAHMGGRGLLRPSDFVALHAINNLHRILHGDFLSAQIMRNYWIWTKEVTHLGIWQENGILTGNKATSLIFACRMQECLDKLGVTMQAYPCIKDQLDQDRIRLRAKSLGKHWNKVIAATDGGLWKGKATEGAIACRVVNEQYATEGEVICEWAGRTLGHCHEVYYSEGEALERVLHSVPEGAEVTCFMDAKARMWAITHFDAKSERARLKVPGRSSLRRIEELVKMKSLTLRLRWVKSHQDDTLSLADLEPSAILNTWADYLTQVARTYPDVESIEEHRPGNDPVTLMSGTGVPVDGPVLCTLRQWLMQDLAGALIKKVGRRRGKDIDLAAPGSIMLKKRVALAFFSELSAREDETLFALRNHELWKSSGQTCTCQGCGKAIHDHHFMFAKCTPSLPHVKYLRRSLDLIASSQRIPEAFAWWNVECRAEYPESSRGCMVKPGLGDFTCLNMMMAEIPLVAIKWANAQGEKRAFVIRKAFKRIQITIAKHITKRREIMYPKMYHPV